MSGSSSRSQASAPSSPRAGLGSRLDRHQLTLFAGTRGLALDGLAGSGTGSRSHLRVRLNGLGAVRAIVPVETSLAGWEAGFYLRRTSARPGTVSVTPGIVPPPVALAGADPTVFAGTGSGLLRRGTQGAPSKRPRSRDGHPPPRVAGPALAVACTGVLITKDEGAAFAARARACRRAGERAGALLLLLDGPGAVRRARSGGVYRSSDGGTTWATSGSRAGGGHLVWLGPFLYAAGEHGFYAARTRASWTRLAASPGDPRG